MCVEKLKFQQQILKHFDVFQWGRKKLWRRSCPYCFPGTTVKRAASSKSPNLQTWEMWANMFHIKICDHSCWSEVPFTAESRNLKSRQTCNRTSAPLDKSTKNVHFCNTCACCCCLSKPTYKVNAVKIIKWHCRAANGIQQLHWGRIKWAPMLWCPSTCSTDDNC